MKMLTNHRLLCYGSLKKVIKLLVFQIFNNIWGLYTELYIGNVLIFGINYLSVDCCDATRNKYRIQ